MKIVLDSNIIVSGILWKGKPGKIVEKWLSGEFTLILSEQLLAEYTEIIERLSNNPDLTESWKNVFVKEAVFIEVTEVEQISRDPDDDFVLALAMKGNADLIISGDRDLLDLKDFPIPILTPVTFLRILP